MHVRQKYKVLGGALLLGLISLGLYTCSMPIHSSSNSQEEIVAIHTSNTQGNIQANYKSGTISLMYKEGSAKAAAIRIFDQGGRLVYGERNLNLKDKKLSFIDFGHMPTGDYQILVLLAGGGFLEDWISIPQ